jgi:hypothetical protein
VFLAKMLSFFVIMSPILSLAHDAPDIPPQLPRNELCASALSGVEARLGVEWELVEVIEMSHHAGLRARESNIWTAIDKAWKLDIDRSNFRNLFAIYTLDEHGHWIKDLLPHYIVGTAEFKRLLKIHPEILISQSNGKWFLRNYQDLRGATFTDLLATVLNLRGEQRGLKLRKIPEAWTDKTGPYDLLIASEVAEEWTFDGRFGSFEFPMHGSVSSLREVEGFIHNLWVRLGLFERDSPQLGIEFKKTFGHVHWVPKIQNAPKDLRARLYDGMVGFWGDINVHADLNYFDRMHGRDSSVTDVRLNQFKARSLANNMIESFKNQTMLVLTMEDYQRLHTDEYGLHVAQRDEDLDITVDPNIPPVFKRLQFALRGKYGQPTFSDGHGIPLVGIEARNQTIVENAASLPSSVARLLEFNGDAPRGLVSDEAHIQLLLKELNIPSDLAGDFIETLFSFDGTMHPSWPKRQVRGVAFLPLSDWLNNPRVQKNISALSEADRHNAVQRFAQAKTNWVRRIKALAHARRNHATHYQPEWSQALREFKDGKNLVYSRSDIHDKRADELFVVVLLSEVARFIREANLATLTVPRTYPSSELTINAE